MTHPVSRRKALGMAAGAAALPLVHVGSAGAAGRLAVAFWDHWVPAGSDALRRQVEAWAAKNKVDVQLDFITSVGNKLQLTAAAEAQARTGHDIMQFFTWDVLNHAGALAPVDDTMSYLVGKYGKLDPICEYLARLKGNWLAVPTSYGSQYKPSCGRIDVFRKATGLDLPAMYPVGSMKMPVGHPWTYDVLLETAPKCQAAGLPFALGLGQTTDSIDWTGSLFAAFGAEMVNAKGDITVKSDAVRQALDYMGKLAKYLPSDIYSYDDASNNRALISGRSALIFNPPSAWAVAKRDAPQVAAQCWTFSSPAGPAGRYVPYLPFFWGVWSFSQNKTAAKDLLAYLMEREQVRQRDDIVDGYDIPPFQTMLDFDIWRTVGPPVGTVYNYPVRPFHDAKAWIAAYPAPPDIAVQIYNQATIVNMIAKVTQAGQTPEQAIGWAENELEGYMH